MKYFVISDVHGFYDEMRKALTDAGYSLRNRNHCLIVCGDVFDRGSQSLQVYDFLAHKVPQDRLLLVKGNHESLLKDLIGKEWYDNYDVSNGTLATITQFAGVDEFECIYNFWSVRNAAAKSEAYAWTRSDKWSYYATVGDYIFVHSWVPTTSDDGYPKEDPFRPGMYLCRPDWKEASGYEWEEALWSEPIEKLRSGLVPPGKIIVCGHWHASAFHSAFERQVDEFGPEADFSIFRGPTCIAIDACTAYTRKVNVLVLDLGDAPIDDGHPHSDADGGKIK